MGKRISDFQSTEPLSLPEGWAALPKQEKGKKRHIIIGPSPSAISKRALSRQWHTVSARERMPRARIERRWRELLRDIASRCVCVCVGGWCCGTPHNSPRLAPNFVGIPPTNVVDSPWTAASQHGVGAEKSSVYQRTLQTYCEA